MRGRLIGLGEMSKARASSPWAGVVAAAGTHEGNARNTGRPVAWSVVATNLRLVTVREGEMGWRKGP